MNTMYSHLIGAIYFLQQSPYYKGFFIYIFGQVILTKQLKGVCNLNEKELKRYLEVYCKSNGIKYNFIAKQLDISESMLSHWRAGRKRLSTSKLKVLQELLQIN